jgi:serine phosphatase RsbU (regulator of sigma subunit)
MPTRRHSIAFALGMIPLLLSVGYSASAVVSLSDAAWSGMQITQGVPPESDATGFIGVVPGLRGGAVTQVYGGSPADLAGIRVGDRVEEIDGISIVDRESLRELSSRVAVGDTLTLQIDRDGESFEVVVRLDSPLRAIGYVFSLVSSFVVALVFGLTGLIVYHKKRTDRRALLFYLVAMLVGSVFLSGAGLTATLLSGVGVSDPMALGPWMTVYVVLFSAIGSLLWPMLLHFSLIFPRERPILLRHPEILKWVYGMPLMQLTTLPLIFLTRRAREILSEGWNADVVLLPVLVALAAPILLGFLRAARARGWASAVLGRPIGGLALLTLAILASLSAGGLAADLVSLTDEGRAVMSLALPLLVLLGLVVFVLVVYPVSACFALYRSYRESGLEERAQLRWPLWGTILALSGLTAMAILGVFVPFLGGSPADIPGWWLEAFSKVFYLLIPVSFAFAILKYRLMEIELVLRKTLVYSVLTAVVLLTYLLLAGGLGGLLVRFAGVESQWVTIAATVVVAGVLVPVRSRVQLFVDHWFFRERIDYPHALRAIANGLRDAPDEHQAADMVAQHTQQAMRSRAVVVFVAAGNGSALRAAAKVGLPDEALERLTLDAAILSGRPGPVVETATLSPEAAGRRSLREARAAALVPIRRGGELLGVVSIGRKLSGEPLDDRDREFCASVADQAAVALENLRLRRRGAEVDMALEIQRHLLPKDLPSIEGYEVAARWQPSRTVAGDYYDVLRLDDGRIGLCIADAAGKGMPAALMMSNLQAAVRALAPPVPAPADLCRQLNDILSGSVAAGKYISFFYADLDPRTGALRYCNAGHNRPLLLKADGTVERLAEGGSVLGAFPDRSYREETVDVARGDRLLMYTDGVTEAESPGGEEFGETRLLDVLRANAAADADAIDRAIVDAVSAFSPGELRDDATLLVLAVG